MKEFVSIEPSDDFIAKNLDEATAEIEFEQTMMRENTENQIRKQIEDLWEKERLALPAEIRDELPKEASETFVAKHYESIKSKAQSVDDKISAKVQQMWEEHKDQLPSEMRTSIQQKYTTNFFNANYDTVKASLCKSEAALTSNVVSVNQSTGATEKKRLS